MVSFLLVIEDEFTRSKLETLYITYKNEMYALAMSILHNAHDAQDVVHTSVLKLAKHIEKIDGIGSNKTKALIVTIVRNSAIDVYRKKRRETILEEPVGLEVVSEEALPLEQIMSRMGKLKEIREQLTALNRDYADVIALKYVYEFTDSEISELLCISSQNTRVRLHRAKAAVKKLIMQMDWE
jgi:RNA polymerase sigma-70 factor (ECF subfamily)